MNTGAWVVSILLGIITVLFTVAVKLALSKITDFHQDAMSHLLSLEGAMRDLGLKLDQHLRDHATGAFHGGE